MSPDEYHEQAEPSTDGNVGIIALGLAGVVIVIMYSVVCWRHRSLLARARHHNLIVNNNNSSDNSHNTTTDSGTKPTSSNQIAVKKHNNFIQNLIKRHLNKNRVDSDENSSHIKLKRDSDVTNDSYSPVSSDNELMTKGQKMNTISEEGSSRPSSDD